MAGSPSADPRALESRPLGPRRALCLAWAAASRERLRAALADGPLPDAAVVGADGGDVAGEPGAWPALRRRVDLYLGIVALDQALTLARWATGAPGGRPRDAASPVEAPGEPPPAELSDDLPMPLAELEAARQRVRAVRNLIVHLGDRLAASLPATLSIDAAGMRARQRGSGSSVDFDEWVAWLDALERWAPGAG